VIRVWTIRSKDSEDIGIGNHCSSKDATETSEIDRRSAISLGIRGLMRDCARA
jgi:hypothetical protein